MCSRLRLGFVAVALLIGAVSGVQPLSAQSPDFSVGGFSSTNVCANTANPAASCQVLTNGSPNQPQVISGGILRLNSADQNQHASAWFAVQQPLSTGFTTAFQFQISSTGSCPACSFPADGMAFVIQGDPAGTGAIGYEGNGQNMSYGDNDVSGANSPGASILNSLSIELDTFKNADYGDPDGNHIAVQSCGPNNSNTLSANSADHTYICPNGNAANLALQSLPAGMSLSDGKTHTITVNYLPPGNCTSSCNNLTVFFDSTQILQATVDLTEQLFLSSGTSAYIGFTAATGASVENDDIISWTFSQWPLAPLTINQPLQPTVTNFNYTSTLSATTDYSQSGLPNSAFQGVFMQGTVQSITDQQFSDLVNNTPFQGSSCQHQDTGNGNFACVVTTDLCTSPNNSTPAGANCPGTGTNPLINVSNTYNLDPAQKPLMAPGYIMGKDDALSCGAGGDNTCKGLVSIFSSISGDAVSTKGHTNNFNSTLIPIFGSVQPSTSVTTTPPLNNGWTNGNFSVNFNSIETVPSNNLNPPSPLPTITSIGYSATGANLPTPTSGTINSSTGSVNVPVTTSGATVFTYAATDSSNVVETLVTNSAGMVSSATPTFTVNVDLIPPTLACTPPAVAWQAIDAIVPCMASDTGGSGLVGPSSFAVQTNVPVGTETNMATIPAVTVKDVAGNISLPQGPFGPFEVDKKPPVINGPTISPASPVFGQQVTASWSCTDGGSGVVNCGPAGSANFAATANTGVLNANIDSSVGNHVFTVLAQDAVGNQSVPVAVNYTVTPSPLSFSTTSINFGTLIRGSRVVSQTITVTNVGNTKVFFSNPTIKPGPGTDPYDFSFADKCRGALLPNHSCTITAYFEPDDVGVSTETLGVNYNVAGSPTVISLTATVIKPPKDDD